MKRFVNKHRDQISGVIGCFDRMVFKGHLPISWARSMEQFMQSQGVLIKDFKRFVSRYSESLKAHARATAEAAGRPMIHCARPERKDDHARTIAERDGITEGLVCVFSALEGCPSFRWEPGEGRPRIVAAARKCLCLYFYYLDRELGLIHVRLQTWFPFTVQICLNGHEVLARKLNTQGIAYRKIENAFTWIADCRRAQRIADNLVERNWPRVFSALARRVNPLMNTLLKRMNYYWVIDQAEYATDVMFKNRDALQPLYEDMLRHATLCLGAEDVLAFLGKKLTGNFQGDATGHFKTRWPGARIKHRVKKNWMKMYNKHGSILRIETVINYPYDFRIRREGKRNGIWTTDWFPMAKRVGNLYRYAQISRTANGRYLDGLAQIENPRKVRRQISQVAEPVRHQGRSMRGFNPAAAQDIALFAAVLPAEHALRGFANTDVRQRLYPCDKTPDDRRRHGATVSRLLKRLHLHGLIAKIPRTRRWRVTLKGHQLMSTFLKLHHQHYPQEMMPQAA